MELTITDRGFELLEHQAYPPDTKGVMRLAQASSAVGSYPDSFDRPGTSFLWIGKDHHLNREEVRELIGYLTSWVNHGTFYRDKEKS